MSDVPELDKLLEEHKIYQQNMWWQRQEIMNRAVYQVVIAVLFSIAFLPLGLFVLVAFPVFWWLAGYMLPPVTRLDPFKRYRSM